jgi:Cys-rich repeat protein
MRWLPVLSVCAGVLLPLPLVLLLGSLLQPQIGPAAPTGMRISPLLDTEQRTRLMTYGRPCRSSDECDPQLGCLYEYRSGQAYCTDSQCTTDAQCPEGQVCLKVVTKRNGPLVRLCIPLGVRQEGEHCFNVPTPEPACLPTCEQQECLAGKQCIRFDEGASACAQVYGTNCQQSPCLEGQLCTLRSDPPQPSKVWLRCITECGKNLPPCAAGLVCDDWQCVSGCDPQRPASCAEGFRCRQIRPGAPFACHPDW